MSDQNDIAVATKPLYESTLFTLAQSSPLLKDFVLDFPTVLAVENTIGTEFPRSESDGDATRILINYRNKTGNEGLYPVLDNQRLDRQFNIDDFLAGYRDALENSGLPEDPILQINMVLSSTLQTAIPNVLNLNDNVLANERQVSLTVLQAITAVVYPDALDIIILIQETDIGDGETAPLIAGMWAVKLRSVTIA